MHAITGRRTRALSSLVGLWFLLCLPVVAIADSVVLTWNPNTEEDLAGYKVYVGTTPAAYTDIIDVGHVTTYTISDLVPGETYYFALTAYDIYANESGYSPEMSTTISGAPSSAPGGTTTPSSGDQSTTSSSGDQGIPQDDDPDSWYS